MLPKQITYSRVQLALTPALSCRTKPHLPSLTLSRCYSLLGLAPNIAHQENGVQQTKMVTTNRSRNMSSLPSVMKYNPWSAPCDLHHMSQRFYQLHRGQVRLNSNLETDSQSITVSPACTELVDTHKVQQVALSEALSKDQQNRLQMDEQLLHARIEAKKVAICTINILIEQTVAIMEDVRKAIAAGEQCIYSLKNDNIEEVLDEFPLLERKIPDLKVRHDKPQSIKDFLSKQETLLNEHTVVLDELHDLRFDTMEDCNELEGQLAAIRMPVQSSSNPQRTQRWIQLNEILERNAKLSDDFSAYCGVKSYFLDRKPYLQPRRHINDDKLDLLENYLSMTNQCSGGWIFSGADANRLHFVAPMLFFVCNLFDGDVDIVVEEDLVGNFVKAQSHFEFMLRRGNKAVCIVLAKKEDFEEDIGEGLVGCEVAAEVEGLDIVYGIVTNRIDWIFLRSLNNKVELDSCILAQGDKCPKRESLKEITEKIYSMLSGPLETTTYKV